MRCHKHGRERYTLTKSFSASLTTWTTQLSTLERRAAEHERYSAELVVQVSDPIKNIAIRYEELRKSHAEFAAKLEQERNTAYSMLRGRRIIQLG